MRIRKSLIFVASCVLLIMTTAFLTSWARPYFLSWTFNYDTIRNDKQINWGGPKEGEQIDLSNLRNEEGAEFPRLPPKSLILLSVVDPECAMCARSKDLTEQAQAAAEAHQIKFFVVSFTSKSPKEKFFRYGRALGKSDGVYSWQADQSLLSPALQKMVVPSHLLINENGIVLRRFPGSSNEDAIRHRLAKQIVAEMLAENANLR